MTVKELITHLQTFDPEALVVCSRYSDVQTFGTDEVTAGRAIVRDNKPELVPTGWYTLLRDKDEATMAPALRPFVRNVVHFDGN